MSKKQKPTIKKSIKPAQPRQLTYSKAFQNRIQAPSEVRDLIIEKCWIVEKHRIVDYFNSGETTRSTVDIDIYGAPRFEGTKKFYANGFVIVDDWDYFLWHCESVVEVVSIINDYKNHLRKELEKQQIQVEHWY